jgi:hypothetical protein
MKRGCAALKTRNSQPVTRNPHHYNYVIAEAKIKKNELPQCAGRLSFGMKYTTFFSTPIIYQRTESCHAGHSNGF